ncbi:MAG: N-acetylglucosaminyldiphosphoundecaprenol N-acetyl-beta-D-mannosaminyltransferase [Solirubrobacteraceae bacterium]|jgi:N-acetylglucosaminyldiphosphoundecaprenol N-acetyl-beta-D-mannosaminyltransferase|nr:N-acetylglucosaminyldiphosphoundecaprenol N-acetyl-beta-D-mannosaminyltransferase [Solirubrobacteraceae bacterium]
MTPTSHPRIFQTPSLPVLESGSQDEPVAGLTCASVLDIPLAVGCYEDVMDWMDAVIRADERVSISAAAVHLVMVAREDPETHAALLNTMTVPDGQPLVWALHALGHPQASRIYGPELMARYCERAAASGQRMYLYGGRNQGALVQLVLNLRRRYPGLNIAGGYSPPFRPQTDEERDAIVAEINGSGADVVWVGIGQPKQEKWMAEMREALDVPILAGVGAAFDFHAGLVPQAPAWMQAGGLEWTYRLAHEPRRLWRRYVRYNPRFVSGFARQYASHRLHAGQPEQ